MKAYRNFYTRDSWSKLSEEIKQLHSYRNCEMCCAHEEFGLKKFNTDFIKNRKIQIERTKKCEGLIKQIKMDEKKNSPPTQKEKENILREANKSQDKNQLKRDITALYGTNTSASQYVKRRKIQFGYYESNKIKDHVGPLESYVFNKQLALDILTKTADNNKDLKDTMNRKWKGLAEKVNLKKQNKPEDEVINKTQVSYYWQIT